MERTLILVSQYFLFLLKESHLSKVGEQNFIALINFPCREQMEQQGLKSSVTTDILH